MSVARYRHGVAATTGGAGVTIADCLLAIAARHASATPEDRATRAACAAIGEGLTAEPFPSASDLRQHFGMDAALRPAL